MSLSYQFECTVINGEKNTVTVPTGAGKVIGKLFLTLWAVSTE